MKTIFFVSEQRTRVWREPKTEYDPENLTYTAGNVVSVMVMMTVWRVIGSYGVGDLLVVYGNVDNVKYLEILDAYLVLTIRNIVGE